MATTKKENPLLAERLASLHALCSLSEVMYADIAMSKDLRVAHGKNMLAHLEAVTQEVVKDINKFERGQTDLGMK